MAVVLPVACFAATCLVLAELSRRRRQPFSVRHILLVSSVCCGMYCTAITEALGATGLLTVGFIFTAWIVPSLLLGGIALGLARGRGATLRIWRPRLAGWRLPELARIEYALLGGLALIVTLTGIVALAAPPNTPDSMTYHLPRLMHWIQAGSTAHFPTNTIRQLLQPPWAEYAMMHLQLLSGGDRFANMVAWSSFLGSMLAASLIAAELGAARRGQVMAAVVAATIPMAIIQATSTQNDLVAGFWLLCCCYFLLAYRPRHDGLSLVCFGGSAGLALLTKGVAYIVVACLLVWFGLWAVAKWRLGAWRPLLVAGALALALNLPFFLRNMEAFGSPLGPRQATSFYVNAAFSPATLAANVTRNTAVELGTPFGGVNAVVEKVVVRGMRLLALDPNDPQATMRDSPPFQIRGADDLWRSDGYTDNPLHLALIGITIIAVFAQRKRAPERGPQRQLLAALVGAFLLFCLYLSWNAQSNRLELPFFVLFAPLCGVVLARIPRPAVVDVVALGLLSVALLWVLAGQSRPLVGPSSVLTRSRLDQYFTAAPQLEAPTVGAVGFVRSLGCDRVGFYASGPQDSEGYASGAPSWEYPFWVLLSGNTHETVRIEQAHVTNASAPLANRPSYAAFHPCAIIAVLRPQERMPLLTTNDGRPYVPAWESGIMHVYVPASE